MSGETARPVLGEGGTPHVSRPTGRISAFIDLELHQRVYALAAASSCAVGRIVEESLLEYVTARPPGSDVSLAARLPRRSVRPSRIDDLAQLERERAMRKRCGRPMKRRPADPASAA